MNDWGPVTYGDPCRECGYRWTTPTEDARALVAGLSERYGSLLAGTDGDRRHVDLAWSAKAYICHVSDNLRIWAQRLGAAASGARTSVIRYHARQLAEAREYEALPIEEVLWSLASAVAEWLEAVDLAQEEEVVLDHPERGLQSVEDVVATNAHDAFHHGWDIACCLGRAERGPGGDSGDVDLLKSDLLLAHRDLIRLTSTVAPSALEGPSLLHGWSRAHVLTHLARNSDGLRNLLLAARTGEAVRMYPSPTARAADISAGATRPAEVVLSDAQEASSRFLIDARALTESDWAGSVLFTSGGPDPVSVPATRLLGMRVEEIVIHLVDLDVGYRFEDVDRAALLRILARLVRRRQGQGIDLAAVPTDVARSAPPAEGVVVSGTVADLVGWLAGRSERGVQGEGARRPLLSPLG